MAKDKLVGPLRTQIKVAVDKSMTDAEERQRRAKGPQGGRQSINAKKEK